MEKEGKTIPLTPCFSAVRKKGLTEIAKTVSTVFLSTQNTYSS